MKMPTRADISQSCKLVKVLGTDYKIAVPFSILHNSYKPTFSIGNVVFDVVNWGTAVKPQGEIPAAWKVVL